MVRHPDGGCCSSELNFEPPPPWFWPLCTLEVPPKCFPSSMEAHMGFFFKKTKNQFESPPPQGGSLDLVIPAVHTKEEIKIKIMHCLCRNTPSVRAHMFPLLHKGNLWLIDSRYNVGRDSDGRDISHHIFFCVYKNQTAAFDQEWCSKELHGVNALCQTWYLTTTVLIWWEKNWSYYFYCSQRNAQVIKAKVWVCMWLIFELNSESNPGLIKQKKNQMALGTNAKIVIFIPVHVQTKCPPEYCDEFLGTCKDPNRSASSMSPTNTWPVARSINCLLPIVHSTYFGKCTSNPSKAQSPVIPILTYFVICKKNVRELHLNTNQTSTNSNHQSTDRTQTHTTDHQPHLICPPWKLTFLTAWRTAQVTWLMPSNLSARRCWGSARISTPTTDFVHLEKPV